MAIDDGLFRIWEFNAQRGGRIEIECLIIGRGQGTMYDVMNLRLRKNDMESPIRVGTT